MSNEIYYSFDEGETLYALIWRKSDDKIYDAVAGSGTFDTYTDADIDDYDVAMANHVDSDYYSVDFPAGIAAGVYRVQIMWQVGVAINADNDIAVAQGEIYWDGTAEIDPYTASVDLSGLETKIDTIDTVVDQILLDMNKTTNIYDDREGTAGRQAIASTGRLTVEGGDC